VDYLPLNCCRLELQTTAIRDALKNLFRQERLPDNPYFFLASVLGAYVDQSPLWKTPATDIAASYDLEGGLEVVDYETKLCRVVEHAAFGLPHVLRLVSKDGERWQRCAVKHRPPLRAWIVYIALLTQAMSICT
jgi:hypothetical protein